MAACHFPNFPPPAKRTGKGRVTALAMHRNLQLLATGSAERAARLWNAEPLGSLRKIERFGKKVVVVGGSTVFRGDVNGVLFGFIYK